MKWDIIFIAGALFTALMIWGIFTYMGGDGGDEVIVLQDGRELAGYPLAEDNIYIISYEDEYNLLMISGG